MGPFNKRGTTSNNSYQWVNIIPFLCIGLVLRDCWPEDLILLPSSPPYWNWTASCQIARGDLGRDRPGGKSETNDRMTHLAASSIQPTNAPLFTIAFYPDSYLTSLNRGKIFIIKYINWTLLLWLLILLLMHFYMLILSKQWDVAVKTVRVNKSFESLRWLWWLSEARMTHGGCGRAASVRGPTIGLVAVCSRVGLEAVESSLREKQNA